MSGRLPAPPASEAQLRAIESECVVSNLLCSGQLRHHSAVDRAQTLALLIRHKPEMQRRFGVLRLALFGSRARDQSRDDSDTDVLVGFDGPADSARYFGLQFYLEDLLGGPVDLVTEKALRPQLRPFVERDAIHV